MICMYLDYARGVLEASPELSTLWGSSKRHHGRARGYKKKHCESIAKSLAMRANVSVLNH